MAKARVRPPTFHGPRDCHTSPRDLRAGSFSCKVRKKANSCARTKSGIFPVAGSCNCCHSHACRPANSSSAPSLFSSWKGASPETKTTALAHKTKPIKKGSIFCMLAAIIIALRYTEIGIKKRRARAHYMVFFEAHQHRFIQRSSRFSWLRGSLLQSGLFIIAANFIQRGKNECGKRSGSVGE